MAAPAILFYLMCSAAHVVYVDGGAAPGGDGSIAQPLRTIQEGIAAAPNNGTVAVHPGRYYGPFLIERSGITIQGLAERRFDADGYIIGFEDEVVLTVDRPLAGTYDDPSVEPEDLVEIRANGVTIRDVVIDAGGFAHLTGPSSAFSAKAEDHQRYIGIEVSHVVFRGVFDTTAWSRNAIIDFDNIRTTDPGFVGLNPTGGGTVRINKALIANKEMNVLFLSLWEFPAEDNGPSVLNGELRNSKLLDAAELSGFYGGLGVAVIGPASLSNPLARFVIDLDLTGNVFSGNDQAGIMVLPLEGVAFGDEVAGGTISIRASGNTYADNGLPVLVSFETAPFAGPMPRFTENSSVIVDDADGAFPAPQTVAVGDPALHNRYLIR
jgi:hypothetical protein